MLIPRRGREEKKEPEEKEPETENPGETDVARRVLAHAASPEEKLEQLLAARSRERNWVLREAAAIVSS